MGVVKSLIAPTLLILALGSVLRAEILFNESYTGADLFELPDGATAPSGRVVTLFGDVLEFTDEGGGELDVLYRVPVVDAGRLNGSELVKVTITVE